MVEQFSPVIFFQWLKLRRKALDMTQSELARRAGCSVGALRKIESGERRPSKQLAGLLADALEIPSEERQTFIRVARGELNIERLGQPEDESLGILADLWKLQENQSSVEDQHVFPVPQIPFPTTTLIGREIEISALERLFKDPQCRLLTLTGIGGIGKTRLAVEFAIRSPENFPGGIFYVPLTPLKSAKEIVFAVADVLDFRFFGSTDPKEQLINFIAGDINQEALFIFDNLEHLLVNESTSGESSSAVELISEFLLRLPKIKILGTSRERLNLQGEWMYELHGLSVPPNNFVGKLVEYTSVELFRKSAQRIKADFEVTDDDEPHLVAICQLVEGVPLAIELAAAWVCVLSCREIAHEIKTSMDFLSTSMHNIPERHRSIRATFDHSWKLLPEEEREVLCQLSIFRGGFNRQAAQEIAGASLDLLVSLNSKSLVRRMESGRYDLHEVIRQYALAHLDNYPGNLQTYERHSGYFLALIQAGEKSLKSAAQQEAMRELTGEIDNIRAAWSWAIKHQKFEQLDLAGRGFGWYFEIAGLYREGIAQLELLVQALEDETRRDQWCRLLGLAFVHQALLYFRKGKFDHAQRLYEESIILLRPVGDKILLADALIFLGIIVHLNGDYERAKLLVEEGLVLARMSNDRWFEAYAVYNLGYMASLMGHYAEGYERMMAGLATWRKLGDPHYIALGLNFLVPTLNKLGRYEEAKTFMQESIALCELAKNRWGLGTAYRYLGLAYLAEGQFSEAQVNLLKSLEIFRDYTTGWDIARSLAYLGDAAMMAGNFPEANNYYQEALQLSVEAKALPIALDALLGLSDLHAKTGETEKAFLLCIYVLNHPSSEYETKSRAQQLREILEPKINAEKVKVTEASAAAKTFNVVVKEALEIA